MSTLNRRLLYQSSHPRTYSIFKESLSCDHIYPAGHRFQCHRHPAIPQRTVLYGTHEAVADLRMSVSELTQFPTFALLPHSLGPSPRNRTSLNHVISMVPTTSLPG